MKNISILGSTGSIGLQAIEVIKKHGMNIVGLAAHSNVEILAEQAISLGVEHIAIFNESKYSQLKQLLSGKNINIYTGLDGLNTIATLPQADTVLNSVVGMVGMIPTINAIKAKKDIALANKETLVAGGKIVTDLARENGVMIYPVDSEHSAIFQCLQGNKREELKKIILTASGGPFFGKTAEELSDITKVQALKHPNWSMGAKITIDSATLMNKGLEFIEAMWLFDLPPEQIEIIVHKESVIHSLVEYNDNSVIAQLGVPDMKIPIQYALTYPSRYECDVKPLDLIEYGSLHFAKPDLETFICLKACVTAAKKGGLYPAAVNGANEAAVSLFLEDKIKFNQIGELVYNVMEIIENKHNFTIDDILNTDRVAREYVLNSI